MKIISGGQTGADRAALDVAIELGMEYGGVIPKGRLAEDGTIDPVKYPNLIELSTASYVARTRKNVQDANATLAFTDGILKEGTKRTVEFAKECGKQYLHIDLKKVTSEQAANEIVEWLEKVKPDVLNVAGPRESGFPGIYSKVHEVLKKVFDS